MLNRTNFLNYSLVSQQPRDILYEKKISVILELRGTTLILVQRLFVHGWSYFEAYDMLTQYTQEYSIY